MSSLAGPEIEGLWETSSVGKQYGEEKYADFTLRNHSSLG